MNIHMHIQLTCIYTFIIISNVPFVFQAPLISPSSPLDLTTPALPVNTDPVSLIPRVSRIIQNSRTPVNKLDGVALLIADPPMLKLH